MVNNSLKLTNSENEKKKRDKLRTKTSQCQSKLSIMSNLDSTAATTSVLWPPFSPTYLETICRVSPWRNTRQDVLLPYRLLLISKTWMVPHQSTKFCGPGTVSPTSKCSDNTTATNTKTRAVRKKIKTPPYTKQESAQEATTSYNNASWHAIKPLT